MQISQHIAAIAVHQVLSGRNLTQALPEALQSFPDATPQQRGAAADLSYGTLRYLGEISAYLNCLLEKPLSDNRIHALLMVALYQLLYDRADDFTVVNQAVQAVTQLRNPVPKQWAKGLVNAILRNFLRKKESLAAQLAGQDSTVYSYPQWWISTLKMQYPDHWQAMLMAGNQHPPMTLRINSHKISVEAYLKLLASENIQANPLAAEAIILEKPVAVEKIPGFNEGLVSVQDYGAQLAAHLLQIESGMRVLDACCAPGGKTGHMLELAALELTALDSDPARLMRVRENLDRLQSQATLKVADAASAEWYDGKPFDRILADVPCTASGIVRRHVDIKWLRRETDIASFTAQQARILPNLWQLLAKGGKLLYVTCSVFNEENQQQVDQFLLKHPDARQLPLSLDAFPMLSRLNGQLLPSSAHDGFFYALLQKI